MRVIDLPDAGRVNRDPDGAVDIVTSGSSFSEQGFEIKRIRLKLYVEGADDRLGPYSLITSEVETDRGSIEMIYDEGYRGQDALDRAAKFLMETLGLSGLVLRSIIALQTRLEKNDS